MEIGVINFASICLGIFVKWLLNSLAMMAGSVMSLPFTWMELILFFDFLVMFIMSLIPSYVLINLSLLS